MRTLISFELDLYVVLWNVGNFMPNCISVQRLLKCCWFSLITFQFDIKGNQKFSTLHNEYHRHISYVRLFVVFTYYFLYYEILATTHHKTTMEASCSCNCTCSGTWVTPMVSVPVHDISFGGDNAMHCSQSSSPRHQLGCNLPSLNRSPRSTDNYNDPNDSNQVILIISAFVIYTVVVILCTLMVSKRLKRCVRNNNQDVWPFFAWFGWVGV